MTAGAAPSLIYERFPVARNRARTCFGYEDNILDYVATVEQEDTALRNLIDINNATFVLRNRGGDACLQRSTGIFCRHRRRCIGPEAFDEMFKLCGICCAETLRKDRKSTRLN